MMGDGPTTEAQRRALHRAEVKNHALPRVSAPRAARLRRLDCCADQSAEVARCPVTDCALWPFRFGYDPWRGQKQEANNG